MPTRKLVTRYQDDFRLLPDRWHKVGLALGLVLVLCYPFHVGEEWLNIANLALVAVVGSIALMVLTGFCGQISLGHAAFFAIGAYVMSLGGTRWQVPFWLLMPVAGLLAAAVGLGIGVFALRLKGLYLAIVTIGLLYLVDHVLAWYVGGDNVGNDVPVYMWFGQSDYSMEEFRLSMDYGPLTLRGGQKIYFLFLVIAVVVSWMARNLARSSTGRAMMAVRDHDLAAASLGVNPARTKILSFGISAFIGGIAGAMYGILYETISVSPFNLDLSIRYIAMIVLGGVGSVFGAVAGALAFFVLAPAAQKLGPLLPLVSRLTTAQQETVLFSLLVLSFLIIEPRGLHGIWLRIKRYFAAWPFRY